MVPPRRSNTLPLWPFPVAGKAEGFTPMRVSVDPQISFGITLRCMRAFGATRGTARASRWPARAR